MKLYFVGLILIPIVLLILPSNFFDNGQTICLSVLLFDQECPGCGMTRGIQHLLHLDFLKASEFNKISFIVLPLLIYLWFIEVKRTRKYLKN